MKTGKKREKAKLATGVWLEELVKDSVHYGKLYKARLCMNCGRLLLQRWGELNNNFAKRRYCDRNCADVKRGKK